MDKIEDGTPNAREVGFKVAKIAVVITTNTWKSCGPGYFGRGKVVGWNGVWTWVEPGLGTTLVLSWSALNFSLGYG